MGPYSGAWRGNSTDNRDRHSKCQEQARCTGPGCRIRTGKTQAKREARQGRKARDDA